jgi:hypothetical protein
MVLSIPRLNLTVVSLYLLKLTMIIPLLKLNMIRPYQVT